MTPQGDRTGRALRAATYHRSEKQVKLRDRDAKAQKAGLPRRRWVIAVPVAVLGALVAAAVLAPWLAPYAVYELESVRLEDSALAPSWSGQEGGGRYLLGTDLQGRDVLSAIMYGLRVSLLVGVAGTLAAALTGILLGLVAGWWRGWTEAALMRLADIQLAFPSILIALFLMAMLGAGVGKIIIAVAVAHWVIYARIVRGAVLAEREKDYISAIRGLGAGPGRILTLHLLPNVMTPVLVISAVEFASVVMLEATLSFLGMGVPPTRPSLGMLIRFGFEMFASGAWWIWLFPGLTLMALVFCLNWLADLLRDWAMTPGGDG